VTLPPDVLVANISKILLQAEPRHNSRIAALEVKTIMQSTDRVTILDSLPPAIREALEDYGAETGLNPDQIVELAIVNFLDMDAITFPQGAALRTLGQLKEENAILKLKLKAAGVDVE
jgi:hypothetical protein